MDQNQIQKSENEVLKNVFNGKSSYIYVFKKISKISIAIYLITDLIKDIEPIKWTLRDIVTSAFSKTEKILDSVVYQRHISTILITLRTALDVARSSRLVSSMNTVVLFKEIDDLLSLIYSENNNQFSYTIPKDFLKVDKILPDLMEKSPWQEIKEESDNFYKGHHIGHKRHIKYNTTTKDKNIESINIQKDTSSSNDSRRDQIISIIKSRNNCSIKDISLIIKNCSEKTIQRDLVDLLSQGKIKKTGERRWSRYSVV